MVHSADENDLSQTDIREAVARVPFLAQAPAALRAAFEGAADVIRLGAGEYFAREGDTCARFAMLVSGRMRVFKFSENGHEITVCNVGPGEACPLSVSCILSSRPIPAMARVVEDIEALVVPAEAFRALVARHDTLRSFVFQMYSTRLSEVMSLVEEVAFGRMDERLAHRLMKLVSMNHGKRRSVEATHAELAADLGTAREVVSRLLKKFEQLGAVGLSRGRIELRDAAPLRAMFGCQLE